METLQLFPVETAHSQHEHILHSPVVQIRTIVLRLKVQYNIIIMYVYLKINVKALLMQLFIIQRYNSFHEPVIKYPETVRAVIISCGFKKLH